MRALVIDETGEGATFRMADVPAPLRVQDEVLVRVIAAGVNPIDRKTKLGRGVSAAIASYPAILGLDFAGVVERQHSARIAASGTAVNQPDTRRGVSWNMGG